jgi:uncharacterized membrane protein
MPVLKVARHINAPRDLVFQLATDISQWPQRIACIDRIEMLTDGPLRVGSRFREARKMFGQEAVEEMEVTGFEPPHRFKLQAESCGVLFISEHEFRSDISGTLVELTIHTKPLKFYVRLIAPLAWLMMKHMKKMVAADLEALKRIAEKRAANEFQTNPEAAISGYETNKA